MAGDRRKLAVLGVGAIALAGALTAAATIAPNRAGRIATPYVPTRASVIVAYVPVRDPAERAERRALATAPDRVELAVELARADISRARALSDPRYLGRAQATLARWWADPAPPADVLLVRATIEQALHAFPAARADLDRLIALRPDDAQAQLTRAVVATVTGDYAAARASCDAVAARAPGVVAAACRAPLDALAGDAAGAYKRLADALAAAGPVAPAIRAWATTGLAELALVRGDRDAAIEQLRRVLAIDRGDSYALGLLADVYLDRDEPAAASALLVGREAIDGLLLRRAIAEHRMHGPEARALADQMRERIAAAAVRGDRIHLREEARFALAVDGDAARAAALAADNWAVQHELADARLVVATAVAAHEPARAVPVRRWAAATGVRDAELDRLFALVASGVPR